MGGRGVAALAIIAVLSFAGCDWETAESPSTGGANCDANYDPCVPEAPDVDCAGGTGDGPAYAEGPISVVGYDVYDLDRDGDGTACE